MSHSNVRHKMMKITSRKEETTHHMTFWPIMKVHKTIQIIQGHSLTDLTGNELNTYTRQQHWISDVLPLNHSMVGAWYCHWWYKSRNCYKSHLKSACNDSQMLWAFLRLSCIKQGLTSHPTHFRWFRRQPFHAIFRLKQNTKTKHKTTQRKTQRHILPGKDVDICLVINSILQRHVNGVVFAFTDTDISHSTSAFSHT